MNPVVPWSVTVDMVRAGALDLAAREINAAELHGSVAELGVYRGDFARLLSYQFPGRELFLFDTFSGFDPRDASVDERQGDSRFLHDFTRTSSDKVVQALHGPERARVRQGWFPDSALGLEHEAFCFVSLDVDLYEPTRAGLAWFFPRLTPGGYIFVHDFANEHYSGVRRAVTESGVPYVVLPDAGTTAVIAKQQSAM